MINNVVTNPASSEESTYQIDGMTCQGCVKRVHAALVPFAETVTVNLNPPHTVLIRPKGDLVVLQNALAGTRYLIKILDKQAERLGDDLRSKQGKSKVAVSTTLPIMPNDQSWLTTYSPLLLIITYIGFASVLVQIPSGGVTSEETMRYFMAGFFLVFSFFKFLDIKSFASAYAGYDILAARWYPWGTLYPFVELALGVAYLLHWQPILVSLATLVVMGFSTIGVFRAVMNKQKIRCACLGSVFQLPMSTVTIVEDVGMAGMAGLMLIQSM